MPASDSTKRCATVSGGCSSGAIASRNPFTEKVWNSCSFQYDSRQTIFGGAFTSGMRHSGDAASRDYAVPCSRPGLRVRAARRRQVRAELRLPEIIQSGLAESLLATTALFAAAAQVTPFTVASSAVESSAW